MGSLVGVESGVVSRLTLNRPGRGNALSAEMLDQIGQALRGLAGDPDARCILLRGEGKHFCAGADLGDVGASAADGARYGTGFEHLLRSIEEHPLPVVAEVQGAALGAGCQLLAACDLVVAAEDAQIGIPSAKLGLLLDLEKIQRMVRVVGLPRTRELLLTGRPIGGREAVAWGLVTKAVKPGELEVQALALAESVAAGAPLSVRGSKAALRSILDHGSMNRGGDEDVFARHDSDAAVALGSEDLVEGMRALSERRPPRFLGR